MSKSTDFDQRWDEIYDEIEKRTGKCDIMYSAYGLDSEGLPTNNLDEVAIHGKVRVRQPADDYFGGKASKPFNGRVLTNPTWFTLFKQANMAAKRTLDEHHAFFESFTVVNREGDVIIIELDMGS